MVTRMDFQEVGRRIREAREAMGLSLRDFGPLLGYSYGTVQGWEKGRRHIGIGDLEKVARVTGRDLTFFLEGALNDHEDSQDVRKKKELEELLRVVGKLDAESVQQVTRIVKAMKGEGQT